MCIRDFLLPQVFLAMLLSGNLLVVTSTLAVEMKDDPKGFEGIPWGATLSESDTFGKVEDAGRLKTYELKGEPPTFGPAKVESMRFTTVDDRFARVTVRYRGREAHDQLLGFLQSRYGPLDRTPGQFTKHAPIVASSFSKIPRLPPGLKAPWPQTRIWAVPPTDSSAAVQNFSLTTTMGFRIMPGHHA
jgi:hypothetical protein